MNKLLPILFLFLFVACDSSDDEDKVVAPIDNAACHLTSFVWDEDEIKYYYDDNMYVIKYEHIGEGVAEGYSTFENNAQGKPIRSSIFRDGSNTAYGHSSFTYNTQGQITREDYQDDALNSEWSKIYEYDSSGKLSKVSTVSPFLNWHSTFIYEGENIKSIKMYDKGELKNSIVLQYDNKHFFGSGSSSQFVTDFIYGFTLPMKHNTTKLTFIAADGQTVEGSTIISYEYNSNGFPIKARLTNVDGSVEEQSFQYQCN